MRNRSRRNSFLSAGNIMVLNQSKTTVSAAAVRDVYQACLTLGVLSDDVMSNLKLDSRVFDDPEARVPESSLIALWRLLDEQEDEPEVGLSIGQTIAPDSKGLLASWVSQANTLGEAIEIFIKNIELMNPSETWTLYERGLQVELVLENRKSNIYPSSATERSMSAMVAWASELSGHAFPLIQARFAFAKPAYSDLFASIFGKDVCFEAQSNSLLFDKTLLDFPVGSRNQLLKAIVEEKAKTVLAELSDGMSLSDKVESLVRNAIAQSQVLTIEDACETLAKSRQTLYRQLKQEGTDFRTIYDETRKKRAFDLLREGKASMSAISLQLGFKDTSSFYKAFQRWTGMSPKGFLKQL